MIGSADVLAGGIIMITTNIYLVDSIIRIGLALFIFQEHSLLLRRQFIY
jgi:Co/Zn/Cd efflux system component